MPTNMQETYTVCGKYVQTDTCGKTCTLQLNHKTECRNEPSDAKQPQPALELRPRDAFDNWLDNLDSFVPTTRLVTPLDEVKYELERAMLKWPAMNSAHEAYGVISEEVEEFWEHVRTNQKRRHIRHMRSELIQIAAMALRAIHDVIDNPTTDVAKAELEMAPKENR